MTGAWLPRNSRIFPRNWEISPSCKVVMCAALGSLRLVSLPKRKERAAVASVCSNTLWGSWWGRCAGGRSRLHPKQMQAPIWNDCTSRSGTFMFLRTKVRTSRRMFDIDAIWDTCWPHPCRIPDRVDSHQQSPAWNSAGRRDDHQLSLFQFLEGSLRRFSAGWATTGCIAASCYASSTNTNLTFLFVPALFVTINPTAIPTA